VNANIHAVHFDEHLAALLEESGLPTGDLTADSDAILFSYSLNSEYCGIVGLELHGACALLRSLVVKPRVRGTGIGEALLAHAEQAATASGVKEIYLLTTTAERYFSRRGYDVADRAMAPAAIALTRQFSELCPSSSVLMVKRYEA